MLATLTLSILLNLSAPAPIPGDEHDTVVMADGKELSCRVLLDSEARLIVRTGGKPREIPRAEVKEVRSTERRLAAFLERFDQTPRDDAKAMAALAKLAGEQELPGEAFGTWVRVLTIDPANEEAWQAIGGTKRKKGWELKVRGRFYTIQELKERIADWKNALELPTAHFLLRTDAPAARAVDVAIDIERTHSTFYRVLRGLDLYVFDEQPEVNVYADPKNFPSPPTPGKAAWFERTSNTLHVDATRAQDSGTIVAELVDALVFNAFRRTLDKTGELEPWIRNGMAQGFAAAVRPAPGRVKYDFSAPYPPYFKAQAADAKPLSIEQVLRAGFASYDSGTDAARYTAQSYTLVHYLANAEDGKFRAAFARYIKSAYLGKGGTSNFFKEIGVDEKVLEAGWKKHVATIAGA
ncbi:MAG: hypothetical protein ABL998_22765 [Planctomycetota bacterium]